MAAPSTVTKGLDYVLSVASGTTVGGGTNAVLTQNQAYEEATNKGSSQWRTGIKSTRSWSVQFDGMYIESSAELAGSGMDFKVGSTSGSGGTSVKGMRDIQLELSAELIDSIQSTTGLDREICPATRDLRITVSGEWYDFDLDSSPTGGDEALEDLVDLLDGTSSTNLECTLSFGSNQSIYANFVTTEFSVDTTHNDILQYTVVIESTGSVTAPTTTGADTGLAAIIADFFDANGVQEVGTALLSTGTTDRIEWTGSAYPESLSVSIPYTGVIGVSGTLQGSGALTKQASS